MNLSENTKEEIQFFVYYLFKGTLDEKLIQADNNYLDVLLKNKMTLYNCFEVFVSTIQNDKTENVQKKVADYIYSEIKNTPFSELSEIKRLNTELSNFWKDFLDLSSRFCFNTFPNPMNYNYLVDLNGAGGDATQIFAVWTNVIEIDDNQHSINAEYALKRTNERLKVREGKYSIDDFKEWELEQEIW